MNEQIPESKVLSTQIEIVDIWPTIQGEGPYSGKPAVFIRLAGCNLQCPHCDTDYTTDRRFTLISNVVLHVAKLSQEKGLVVITGGEPFRQNATVDLIRELRRGCYKVQVETNGTFCPDFRSPYEFEGVVLVVSPKTPKLHEFFETHSRRTYYKYVLDHEHVDLRDGLPSSVLGMTHPPARPPKWIHNDEVFVQPMDHGGPQRNQLSLNAAVQSCQKYGYRFCLQLHKMIGAQ